MSLPRPVEAEAAALGAKDAQLRNLLEGLIAANHQRAHHEQIDLSELYASLADVNTAYLQLWADCAARLDLMIPSLSRVAHVLGTTPQLQEAEDATLRQLTAHLATARLMGLVFRVEAAIFSISARSEVCGSPIEDVLDDAIWQLKVLPDDIMPAFESTYLVVNQLGPLASDARAVLDDIVAGLQDFAAGVDDVTNRLHALGGRADVPGDLVKLLDQIPEAIWLAANDVRCLLDARVQAPSDEAAPQRTEGAGGAGPATEAAAPARTGATSGPSRGRSKKKAKGKEQGRTAAARSAAALSARASSPTSGGRAAPAMALGRSALGTRLLVEPEQAIEPEQAKVRGATPPPPEPLAQRLARMLSFDLPAQQREISRARSACSPENAAYVAEQAAKRLEAQAAEMQACLAELGNHQERLRLAGPQLIEAHQQAEHLKHLLNQVKGEADSLMENMHMRTIEHMKTYPFPTQAHIEQLRQAGALLDVEAPRTLGTEPATLFEIKIQPERLRSGSWPRPMWVHLHTRQPVRAWQLPELRDADFTACHVKSDVERGRNREWQNAQAAAGRENVMIYRGRLEPALCKSLMAHVNCPTDTPGARR